MKLSILFRKWSLLLALCALFCIWSNAEAAANSTEPIPPAASILEAEGEDSVSFLVYQGELCEVYGGTPGSDLVVPSVVDGQTITKVAPWTFNGTEFGSITLPDTVTEIGEYAFYFCSTLKSITLPDSITSIGDVSFFYCTGLESIKMPAKLTSIGASAFYECSSLKSISLPDGLKTLPNSLFSGCSSLESIKLPGKLTNIEKDVFASCSALKSISLPNTVSSISSGVFSGCSSLESVTLSNALISIGSRAFANCSALETIVLPSGLKTIPDSLFYGCSSLKNVTLPTDATSIGKDAFCNCTSLTGVTLPAKLTSLGSNAFEKCSALKSIAVPSGVTQINGYTFYSCSALETVTLKADGVNIEDYAFIGCDSLKTIDSQITHISNDAFDYYETKLTSIGFSDKAKEIPEAMLALSKLIITVGQDSRAMEIAIEYGRPYRIRQTGEVFNLVTTTTTSVSKKVDAIVAALIRPGMSNYQKALALHNWLIMNANYDYTFSNYSAAGVLIKGTGVCQSYASAYALLLDKVGIPNCLEYGEDHVWNMIQLDGEWYHVDATWDDPNEGGFEGWDFFCVSNYALQGVPNHECYNKPHIATGYKYNYFYYNGKLDARLKECRDTITQNLQAGQWQFEFTPASFEDWNGIEFNATDMMMNCTTLLVMQDTAYEINGTKANLEITYDDMNNLLSVTSALAEPDMHLPAALTTIGEEAFAGVSAGVIYIPDGATSIGARAFSNCSSLWQVRIPSSVKNIDASAFSGVQGLCIYGKSGSAAEAFANTNGYGFCPEK